ncbi:hypothetical protein [Roseibium sp. MMSF_3544]|uniref:hypothetical protein n=1 Tax=unclassified Roseibium TaxID=2629323 RepID=UPI00273DE0CE|nr:hypothetical protein [Roseibium sp. MMSF_3544]
MAQDSPGLGARLMRLPGQLLLALVNATALLVIAACVLALVVLNRVDQAGAQLAGTVTEAALSKLDMTPSDLKSSLQAIGGRIEELSVQMESPGNGDNRALTQQLNALNQNLNDLKLAAQNIGAVGPEVTDAAFRQAGSMLTDSLFALRGCTANQPTGAQGS